MVKKNGQYQGYAIPSTFFFKQYKVKLVDAHKIHAVKLINRSVFETYRKKQDPIEGGISGEDGCPK